MPCFYKEPDMDMTQEQVDLMKRALSQTPIEEVDIKHLENYLSFFGRSLFLSFDQRGIACMLAMQEINRRRHQKDYETEMKFIRLTLKATMIALAIDLFSFGKTFVTEALNMMAN